MVGAALYISGKNIPFSSDIVPRITRKSYDVDNPNQIWGDYSKSIEIPGTAETDSLFSYLFDVNTEIQGADFNPNLKASARIDYNDTTYIEGYCQLTNIKIDDFGKVTYTVVIYGTVASLFTNIGQGKLTDIDLSEYDHTWNEANVVSAWSPTLGSGYVYPMIDYGLVYKYEQWNAEHFYPAIFAKEYFDRIFEAAGFTYTSAFLESERFKRMIIPCSDQPQLTESDIADRIFYLSRATTAMTGSMPTNVTDISSYDTLIFNDDSSGNNFNTSGNDYNTGTGVWSVGNKGRYCFRGQMTVTLTRTNTTVNIFDSPEGTNVRFGCAVVKYDGSTYSVLETFVAEWDGYAAGGIAPTTNSAAYSFEFTTGYHELFAGDDIYIAVQTTQFYSSWHRWVTDQRFDYSIAVGAIFTINIDPVIVVGDTMLINNTIPVDIYQKDFIMGIFKLFNLFVEVNSYDPLNLIIEPYNAFFAGSEDITAYLDTSKTMEIVPMGMLQGKRYKFKYTEDKDYLNAKYLQEYSEVYGTQNKDVENDFLTNTYTIEPIFSATPSSSRVGNDRVVPDMRFVDQNGNVKVGKTNIRILYWGGLKNCVQWVLGLTNKTQYPYAGHLDDPYSPTEDFCFGVPQGIYIENRYGSRLDQEYTNNNLYNAYWSDYIDTITNENSKLVSFHFDLSNLYQSLSFRKTYYIAEAYYRLVEIVDFAVDGLETTKCVFIKVPAITAFSPTTESWRGGDKSFPTGEKYPQQRFGKFKGGGDILPESGIKNGTGGISGGGVLMGNEVNGSVGFKNVNNFSGDGNRMSADKITMIGTEDYMEYREGATIINNIWAWSKLEVTLTGTEAGSLSSSPIEVLPPCSDNEYYEISKMYVALTYNEGWTGSAVITLETSTSGSVLETLTTGLYNASADAYLLATLGSEVLDMGEGITLTAASDVADGDTNIVKFIIYYRINRL